MDLFSIIPSINTLGEFITMPQQNIPFKFHNDPNAPDGAGILAIGLLFAYQKEQREDAQKYLKGLARKYFTFSGEKGFFKPYKSGKDFGLSLLNPIESPITGPLALGLLTAGSLLCAALTGITAMTSFAFSHIKSDAVSQNPWFASISSPEMPKVTAMLTLSFTLAAVAYVVLLPIAALLFSLHFGSRVLGTGFNRCFGSTATNNAEKTEEEISSFVTN